MDTNYQQVAKIKVFGVGGGGNNAVNRMVQSGAEGAEFYVCNTDVQILNGSVCENRIKLGPKLTNGLGAGGQPAVGEKAAEESIKDIEAAVKGADMVFVAAGMGGGTGTGAAPVIAKVAKEAGCLTIGVVTKPFAFEGKRRMKQAEEGIEKLKQYTDAHIIVGNNKLLEIVGNVPVNEAFAAADNVLKQGVTTITDLIAIPSLINLDFADVSETMKGKGAALIGVGYAQGENAAKSAAMKAVACPLLEGKIKGATNAIVNVTGGENMSIKDALDATDTIKEVVGDDLDIIFGLATNTALKDNIVVTVIATGFTETEKVEKKKVEIPTENNQTIKIMEVDDMLDIPAFKTSTDDYKPSTPPKEDKLGNTGFFARLFEE